MTAVAKQGCNGDICDKGTAMAKKSICDFKFAISLFGAMDREAGRKNGSMTPA